jgi:hypothetical protein
MKSKIFKIAILILIHTSLISSYAIDPEENNEDDIIINSYINIDLDGIVKGTRKTDFLDDQLIIFEIKCKQNRNIRILKVKEPGNEFVRIETEWRAGANTGFEEIFEGNTIYRCDNDKFYVTVKIKSIEVMNTAPSGLLNFSPAIAVEYVDM